MLGSNMVGSRTCGLVKRTTAKLQLKSEKYTLNLQSNVQPTCSKSSRMAPTDDTVRRDISD